MAWSQCTREDTSPRTQTALRGQGRWFRATRVPSFLLWKLNHGTGPGYEDIWAPVVCVYRGQTKKEKRDLKRRKHPLVVSQEGWDSWKAT
jgi:hypothetical protein